jgi:MFS transporter, DHA3 family, macrolide efflux protein
MGQSTLNPEDQRRGDELLEVDTRGYLPKKNDAVDPDKLEEPVTFKRVIQNRQFRALWLAQLVSSFGDWLALLALFSFIAFRLNGTPAQIGWMLISFTLPVAFLGPVAGVFVDRWNLKRTMIGSDLIRAFLAALIALSTELYQIYALVFAMSAVSCFFLPAQTVAIPLSVRKEELLVANSINAQTLQLIRVISPAAAGALVAWAGEKVCFYLDSASFLLSAAILSVINLSRKPEEHQKGINAVTAELLQGLKYIKNNRDILFLIVTMTSSVFAIAAFDSIIVVYVRDILNADSRIFGTLISLVGIGTILGSFVIGKFGQRWSKLYLVILGIFWIGLNILSLAVLSSTWATLACSFSLGLSAACVLIPSQTLLQEESPQSLLGRVSSTAMSLMTTAQLGAFLIAGTLAAAIGVRNLYYSLAAMLVVIAALGYGYEKSTSKTKIKEHFERSHAPAETAENKSISSDN